MSLSMFAWQNFLYKMFNKVNIQKCHNFMLKGLFLNVVYIQRILIKNYLVSQIHFVFIISKMFSAKKN